MLKRVVSISILVVMLTILFCVPSYAETVNPEYITKYSTSHNMGSGYNIYFRAMEFSPVIGEEIVNVSGSPGIRVYDATVSVLCEIKIVNTTDGNKWIDPLKVSLLMDYPSNFPNGYGIPRGIKEIISYSDDLILTYNFNDTGYMTLMPSSSWCDGNNIVVPAHTSLVALAEIKFNAYYQYDSNGYTSKYPTINKFDWSSTPTYGGTTYNPIGLGSGGSSTNYSSVLSDIYDLLYNIDGTATSISGFVDGIEGLLTNIDGHVDQLEGYVDGIEGLLNSIDSHVDGVEGLLTDIRSLLSWSGSFPTVTYSDYAYRTFDGTINSIENLTYHVELNYAGAYCVLDSTDFETPNTLYQNKVYKHRYVAYISVGNYTGTDYLHAGNFQLYRFLSSNYRSIDISAFYSESFVDPFVLTTGGYTSFYMFLNRDDPVLYNGTYRAVVYFDVYRDTATSPTINDTYITGTGWSSYTDNLTDASDSLATQSNQAHSQEQAYFNQNSQAIADTGLSNYHFSTTDGNGVASVSVDFTNLWNALGGWTTVYIFSLTLGLALSIIKHSPNAINRKIRNRQSE